MPTLNEGAAATETARLAARVGRLLLTNGADTDHAAQRIDEVARRLGHPVRRLVTAEAIIVGTADGDTVNTRIGLVISGMGVDVGRIVAIEKALDGLRTGAADAAATDRRLDAIEVRACGYPMPLVMVGLGVAAASLARLFGADWPVAGAAFAAGFGGTALRLALGRRHFNASAATFLVALLSGLIAALAIRLAPASSPVFCLTAAGMILVPGVPLINGVRDLVEGHAGNAVARLALAGSAVLAIGFALFLAAEITGAALPVGIGPGTLPVAQDLLFSATAAAGYATLFNVPPRAIPACMLCGMASHGLRTALAGFGVDVATGSLIGALAAGLVAQGASQLFRAPPVAFAFPGIVAMIPGSYGFRAGIGGLHLMALGAKAPAVLIAETLSLAVTTAVVTIAIGIGLTLSFGISRDGLFNPRSKE
jgi:uncharacterized membrane protein YjjP (DUF1212 family)